MKKRLVIALISLVLIGGMAMAQSGEVSSLKNTTPYPWQETGDSHTTVGSIDVACSRAQATTYTLNQGVFTFDNPNQPVIGGQCYIVRVTMSGGSNAGTYHCSWGEGNNIGAGSSQVGFWEPPVRDCQGSIPCVLCVVAR